MSLVYTKITFIQNHHSSFLINENNGHLTRWIIYICVKSATIILIVRNVRENSLTFRFAKTSLGI